MIQVMMGSEAVKSRYGSLIDYIHDEYSEGAKVWNNPGIF